MRMDLSQAALLCLEESHPTLFIYLVECIFTSKKNAKFLLKLEQSIFQGVCYRLDEFCSLRVHL